MRAPRAEKKRRPKRARDSSAGLTRYFFHGDVTDDGHFWYSARGDAFLPLPMDREPTVSDVKRYRRAVEWTSERDLERIDCYRPLDAQNLFAQHDLLLLPEEELDRRLAQWFAAPEYAQALEDEWAKIYARRKRWAAVAEAVG